MATLQEDIKDKDVTLALVKQMTTLATSGLGLVAALAWNNVINELVNSYIKPYISKGSGIISLILYAVLITALAVIVTWQLTKVEQKIEQINRTIKTRVDQAKNRKLLK